MKTKIILPKVYGHKLSLTYEGSEVTIRKNIVNVEIVEN